MRVFRALSIFALLCVCAAVSGEPAVLHPGLGPGLRTSGEVLLELSARTGAFADGDYVPQPGRVVKVEFLAGHEDDDGSLDVTTVEDKGGGDYGYVNTFNFAHVSANALRRVYRARLNLPTTGVRAVDMRARLQADQDDDGAKIDAIVAKYPPALTTEAIEGGKLDQFLEGIRAADDETLRAALLDRLERVVERIRGGTRLDSDVLARAVSIMETQLDKEEEVVEQEGPRVDFVRSVATGTYAEVAVAVTDQELDNMDYLQNLFAEARSGDERVLGTFNVRDLSVTSRTRHDFVKLAYVIARNLPDILVVQEVRDGLGETYDDVYEGVLKDMKAWFEERHAEHLAKGNVIAPQFLANAGKMADLLKAIDDPRQECATVAQFDTLKEIHHEFAASEHLRNADTAMRSGGSIATLVYHINHLLGVNLYTGATTAAVQTGAKAKPEGYGVIWRRDRVAVPDISVDDDAAEVADDDAARAPDRKAACFHAVFDGATVPVCTSHLHFGAAYDNDDDVEIRMKELLRMRQFAEHVGGEVDTDEFVLLGDFNLPPSWVAAIVAESGDLPDYDAAAEDVAGMQLAVNTWAHATTVGDVSSFDNLFATDALGLHVEGVPPLVTQSRFGWIDTFDEDLYAHPKRSLAEAAGCLPHEQACRVNHAERDELHCPAHCDLIWADYDNEEKRVNQLARKQVSDHRPVFTTLVPK